MVILAIIISILSLIGYFFSPYAFSLPYCLAMFMLFLIISGSFLLKQFREKNYFNFHLFFLLSYFLVNYAYPVFIYKRNPFYFPVFKLPFDHNLITKGLSLAQVGISFFILGSCLAIKRERKYVSPEFKNPTIINILKIFLPIVSIVFLTYIFRAWIYEPYLIELDTMYVNTFIVLFSVVIFLMTITYRQKIIGRPVIFLRYNFCPILIGTLVSIACIWFGDRGPAIQIAFIMLYVYNRYVIRINFKAVTAIILIGFISMALVSYTRVSPYNFRQTNIRDTLAYQINMITNADSLWYFGVDLIGTARNMYIGIEHVNRFGYLYGKSYFPMLFAPIPGLPSLMTKAIFDKGPEELSTADIITKKENIVGGLGTNAVVDLYMNFGLIGVCLGFFAFARAIKLMEKSNSIYAHYLSLLIFAQAIYYPRSSIFIQVTLLIRGAIIIFLLLAISNRLKKPKIMLSRGSCNEDINNH